MATIESPRSPTSGTKAMIHAVVVVPMLEPMITLMACVRLRRPDETNPTAMTVMIEEDCTMIVEMQPVITPARRCVVARDMNFLSPRPLTA